MIEVVGADLRHVGLTFLHLLLQLDNVTIYELEDNIGQVVEQCNGTHIERKPLVLQVECLLQRFTSFVAVVPDVAEFFVAPDSVVLELLRDTVVAEFVLIEVVDVVVDVETLET